MANPNKAAGYKRKTVLLQEECRNDRQSAERLRGELREQFAGRRVTIKLTSFRTGPRIGTHGCTKQTYSYMVRVYEKDTQ